jgi:hypothetical protein
MAVAAAVIATLVEMGVEAELAATAMETAGAVIGAAVDPVAAVTSRAVASSVPSGIAALDEAAAGATLSSRAAGAFGVLQDGMGVAGRQVGYELVGDSAIAGFGETTSLSYGTQVAGHVGETFGRGLPSYLVGKSFSRTLRATSSELHSIIESHLERNGHMGDVPREEFINQIINRIHAYKARIRKNKIEVVTDPTPFTMTPWPKTRRQTLRWCTNSAGLASGATNDEVGVKTIKLNDLINPGGSFSDTHEPLGFSQMAAIYDQYVVNNVNIRVDWFCNEESGGTTSNNFEAVICGLALKDDATPLTVAGHYQELNYTQWIALGPEQTGRQTMSIKPNRFFGIPDKQIKSESTLRGIIGGASPTNQLYLHLFVHEIAHDLAGFASVEPCVTIEFDVTFMEPKDIAQTTTDP